MTYFKVSHLYTYSYVLHTSVGLSKCTSIAAVDYHSKLMNLTSSVLFLSMLSPHMQVICYNTLRNMPGSYQGTPPSQVLDVVRK
jgi:hypothetical protein